MAEMSKRQKVNDLYFDKLQSITANGEEWMNFLHIAAMNYKYSFREQVLIAAQAPGATACADYYTWNKLGRYINKDANSISLITPDDVLKNVFDVVDTNGEPQTDINLWMVDKYNQTAVFEALNKNGANNAQDGLSVVLLSYCQQVISSTYQDAVEKITAVNPNNKFFDTKEFETMLAVSVAYMSLVRSGLDDGNGLITADYFNDITKLESDKEISLFGQSVSTMAETVLRIEERAVKKYDKDVKSANRTFDNSDNAVYTEDVKQINTVENNERSSNNEKVNLHKTRRLQLSRHLRRNATTTGEIRTTPQGVPTEEQNGRVHSDVVTRNTVPSSDSSGQASQRDARLADGSVHQTRGDNGGIEEAGYDGLGRSNQQYQGESGGDNLRRTDIRLEFAPSEEEQKEYIEKAVADDATAFAVPQSDIDSIIARGSGFENGKYRIYDYFIENHNSAEKATFLKDEYGTGGSSPVLDKYSVNYDSKGITISIRRLDVEVDKNWSQVSTIIDNLITNNRYLNSKELEHLPVYHSNLALREERINLVKEYKDLISSYNDFHYSLNDDSVLNQFELVEAGSDFVNERKSVEVDGKKYTLPLIIESLQGIQTEDSQFSAKAEELLVSFTNEKYRYLMPTDSELLKDNEPTHYDVKTGDEVTIRTTQYVVTDVTDKLVILCDANFPLMTASYAPDEFQQLLADSPFNDRFVKKGALNAQKPTPTNDEYSEVQSVWSQYSVIQNGNPGSIVLYQLGDFIEAMGADAHVVADILDYKLTQRAIANDGTVALCGAPIKDLEQVVNALHDNGHNVVISHIVDDKREIVSMPCEVIKKDAIYTYPDNQRGMWQYYNPDGNNANGQYVSNAFTFADIRNAAKQCDNAKEFFDYLSEVSEQTLVDSDSEYFKEFDKEFKNSPALTDLSEEVMQNLIEIAGQEVNKDEYNKYVGKKIDIDGHTFIVEYFTDNNRSVSLADMNMKEMGYPLNRVENAQKIIALIDEKESGIKNTAHHQAYLKLQELAPQILTKQYSYVKFMGSSDAFEPFSIERIGGNQISLMHTYVQNGDLMRDPDIVVSVNEATQELIPVSFEQSSLGQYTEASTDRERVDIGHTLNVILSNVIDNDYNPVKAIEAINGVDTDISFVSAKQEVETVENTFADNTDIAEPTAETIVDAIDDVVIEKPLDFVKGNNYKLSAEEVNFGGPKKRFTKNIAAIELVNELDIENRPATAEEQEILSQYVGWGGLDDAFDRNKANWSNEYKKLKDLLSDEEYSAARESTLTAFYTPPYIISSIYKALDTMGFINGNILEPACGIGNFIGMLPDNMADSKFTGIELDSVSGRIAKRLYPQADISIQGYEKANIPNDYFDIAVGNVPFDDFKVADKEYDKNNFMIHDYFFAKTIDKVRPGGIIAFITSQGTLDKNNSNVRRYIAQRAELIGAIRLPNNAFKTNAGTDVTSDIIFLQKREDKVQAEPDWVYTGTNDNGIPMNNYFVNHPEMIMGKMDYISGSYGPKVACLPDGSNLSERLNVAITNLKAEYDAERIEMIVEDVSSPQQSVIPLAEGVRNYSYAVVDDALYYCSSNRMVVADIPKKSVERVKELVKLRDTVRTLLSYEADGASNDAIIALQAELNTVYDNFVKKYGYVTSKENKKAFSNDSSYALLTAIENVDGQTGEVTKADIFDKITVKKYSPVTSCDTASEALAVSLVEKACVDLPYMSSLTNTSEEDIVKQLQGSIYRNLSSETIHGAMMKSADLSTIEYVTAEEYLSGNVRAKLQFVESLAMFQPNYADEINHNIEALKQVQPKDLTAAEINVRLGTTWIPQDDITDFLKEVLGANWCIKAKFAEYVSEWNIEGKSADKGNVKVYSTYGTVRKNAYQIVEDTLNLRDVRVFDYVENDDGKRVPILNKKETAIAQGKQQLIQEEFKNWIWSNQERRQRLTQLYNEKFNSVRPREYSGSNLTFPGSNPEISLRKHQVDAIAHIIYGGNTLLAHVVGAGKTYEMVAAAMESKRLGLCTKSLFVVPNHLTEQWGTEFMQLYPNANILVATKKDFETANRKAFCARIATGDYDAVIIGHSQFEKIPMSYERQHQFLQSQLDEILDGISELKYRRGEQFTVKALERAKKSIVNKLDKLNDNSRKDDVVTFEELGVDRLFVDEAHSFKNLFIATKMRNVGGISQTEAQKSSDMYIKCRYLDEVTNNHGVVFATGTPVSNSMVEMYTMQRYLQYDTLRKMSLQHFDAWASTFGETVTAIELAPEGTGYRSKTRFAKFYNLPELMTTFKEVADIKTADMLQLPVPKANYHNVAIKPSEQQKSIVATLADRAEAVHNNEVDSSVDNMLVITNDGRKLALDQRLYDPLLPDSDTGKVAVCADNVYDTWNKTKENKSTQLIFCDLSTPHYDGKFNVYDDIKKKLVDKGIPSDEIAFIHDAPTEVKKKAMFDKVRVGEIRVLIGSTQKMGTGTNVQKKLIAVHHLDCPWRPADLQQREGRIVRQGNENPEVDIFSYVTENTFDAYLYQIVESKQKFIGQIMTSKSPARSADDVDETALSYAEVKALATGNPYIKEKMDLDIDVARLRLLKSNFDSQKYELEDKITATYPDTINYLTEKISLCSEDVIVAENNVRESDDDFEMAISNKKITDKKTAGRMIIGACEILSEFNDSYELGSYRGFIMSVSYEKEPFRMVHYITLKNKLSYKVELGDDVLGNITRIDNKINAIDDYKESLKEKLQFTEQQLENAKEQCNKEFPYADELITKSARLQELNALLDMDHTDNDIVSEAPSSDTDKQKLRQSKANER